MGRGSSNRQTAAVTARQSTPSEQTTQVHDAFSSVFGDHRGRGEDTEPEAFFDPSDDGELELDRFSANQMRELAAYEAQVMAAHYQGYKNIPRKAVLLLEDQVSKIRKLCLNETIASNRVAYQLKLMHFLLKSLNEELKTFPAKSRRPQVTDQIERLEIVISNRWPAYYSDNKRLLENEYKALVEGKR